MARATRNFQAMGVVFGLCLGYGLVSEGEESPRMLLISQQQKLTKKKSTKSKKSAPTKPATSADSPAPAAAPTTDGALKFSKDIAPILVANCAGCHNDKHRSGFNQTTFDGLLKGGKAGPAIVPGKPDESLLLARVKGEEGAKMPPGQRDLSPAAIEKLEAWIKSGARLDAGLQSSATLASYASTPEQRRQEELAKMSPNDRDKKTETVGLERLKKANSASEPEIQKGTNFMLFSKLPKERANSVLKGLDGQFATLKRMLTTDKPALAGPEKISLYVFKDRGGYVEFVRSIENQEVDDNEMFRAKLTVESPYVIAIDPLGFGPESASSGASRKGSRSKKGSASSSDEGGPDRSLVGILMEGFSSGAIAQAGGPPWVASGLGAYLASQVEPRSRYYSRLRAIAYEQCRLGWVSKATETLGGQAKLETARAVGFALFEWINANAAPLVSASFVQGMLQGQAKLDDAIQHAFGMNREQFLTGSGEWIYARYGARGR